MHRTKRLLLLCTLLIAEKDVMESSHAGMAPCLLEAAVHHSTNTVALRDEIRLSL